MGLTANSFYNIEDQIGGFCEVYDGDYNDSIVIKSSSRYEDTIKKRVFKFESSTTKTV